MSNVHWLLSAALCGALCSCYSRATVQDRDRADVRRGADARRGAIRGTSRRPSVPDGPIPVGAVADTFNTGRQPVTEPKDPTRRTMGLKRADDVALRIDSIFVTPGVLSLKVGDTLSLRGKGSVTWEAKDSDKHVVRDFWPVFSVSDSSIMRLEHLRLRALRVGESELLVSATVSDTMTHRQRVVRTTRVRVSVK